MATRYVLHFSDEPGAAEALSLACSAHLDAGLAATSLQVALVPRVNQWHDANSFRALETAVPLAASTECSAALAHRLVGSMPAEAWLELSWHATARATEQAGLAPYGAWTHALQRGLRCQVTVVSGADDGEGADDPPPGHEQPPSIEHWCELLQASRLLLPAGEEAAALTRLFETPCHWRGSVRLPGAELDGVRLCPYPEGGCAGGASSADPSEAPPAGSVLEALRPLRVAQLPRHLRLPHRWEVRGTPGEESDRSLKQWAQAQGCDAECAADAMLVRVEPATASTSTSALGAPPARAQRARTSVRRQQAGSQGASTLLLFCEEGRVWAQACAEPGGLAAAVLYLECAEAGVAPEEEEGEEREERESRTHTPAGKEAGGEVEGRMGEMEADGGSGGGGSGGGSGGSGRGRRSSGRSSQERKRPAGPAAEEGEEGEVRRRVRPREVPAEAGEAWAERLDLDKAASFRETTRGPAAPARWRQAESRALQQLRLVAPPAATAEPPAATAAAPPAAERHSSASNASSAPPPMPAASAAAAEMAPPTAADTCAAAQPSGEGFLPIASANPGLPLGLCSDPGPQRPDASAQRRGPGSSAGSTTSHASRASLHSRASRNSGGSDRGAALQSSVAAPPRQRGAFGVAAKAAARPVQSNAAGGRARGHLLLSATGGSAGGAAASGGGGGGGGAVSGEEHGTAGPGSGPARQSSNGAATTAAAAAAASTPGDGLGVTIQDVLRGCSDLVPTDADGGPIWPDLPDGPPPPPTVAWARAAPYEGPERQAALERLLPAPEAEYCSLLCTSMSDVLPYARVGRFRAVPPDGRSTSRGAAAGPAAARLRSAPPLGAPAAADEPPRMGEGGGAGSSVRKASTALVKRHAKRMLQQFATSCELFSCRAARQEGFLKAEVAQVTQAALRELGQGTDLDVVSVKEPDAKAAVSEALCALMFAGAASLARQASVRGKPPVSAAAAASAMVDDGVP